MCMANALWARLDRVVFGATIADANRHCLQIHIAAKEVVRRSDMHCIVDGPVLRDLCNTPVHPSQHAEGVSHLDQRKKQFQKEGPELRNPLMDPRHIAELISITGDESRVLTQPLVVEQLSRDFYWYSPVLRKLLDGKVAEVVVQPLGAAEIQSLLRYCYDRNIPVTVRGAGTGNYGQAVPLQGGVVLDLTRMDQIEEIQPDGVAVCQPGVRLGVLENEARKLGWELRCYPSTIVKSSLGGFLGGGSGGIGSVANGNLRDFETVRAIEVVTMEPEPRVVLHEGEAVHEILHAWGTNGIITRIWLALAPAVEWSQCVVAFDTFDAAFDFSEQIATGAEWTKRLVTAFEWPISSFFTPVKQYAPEGKSLIFFLIASDQLAAFESAAREAGGEVTYSGAYLGLRSRPLLSDYTWNHTTLWAMRADDAYTYLQCGVRSGYGAGSASPAQGKVRRGDSVSHGVHGRAAMDA